MVMPVIGLIVTLAILIFLLYKGISPILVAPLCSVVLAAFSGLDVLSVITNDFSAGFGGMVVNIGLMLIGSTLFGEVMSRAGATESIAIWISDHLDVKRCTWALVISSTIMSYGGMAFGAYMVLYPVGMILCKKANYNKGIIMGTVLGGSWTYAMTGPGAPTVGNVVPANVFGTGTAAGLVPGLVASVFIFIAINLYLDWQARTWEKKGRGFQSEEDMANIQLSDREKLPNIIQAIFPIIVCLVLFNLVKIAIGPCLFISSFVACLTMYKQKSLVEWVNVLSDGAKAGMLPVGNLGIIGGFSAVMRLTPIFTLLAGFASTSTMNPYLLSALLGSLFAFFLGSSSNAVGMMMGSIPEVFLSYGARGFSMGSVHRMLAMGSGGASIMPHAGSMATMNVLLHTNFKESYFPVFISCVVIPLFATYAICLPLCIMGL